MDFILILLGIGIYIAFGGNNTSESDNESKTKLKDGSSTVFLEEDKENSNESLKKYNVKNVKEVENIIIPDEVQNTSNKVLKNRKHMKKAKTKENSKFMIEKDNNPIRNNNKLERVADYDDFYSSIRKNYRNQEHKENNLFFRKFKRKKLLGNQDDESNDDGPIKRL